MTPGPGARPPWWPEGEPFPPRGRPPGWGGPPWAQGSGHWVGGRRFRRRIRLYVLGFVVLVSAAGAATVWLVGNALGANGAGPAGRVASVVLLLAGFLALGGGGRVLRRFTTPVGEVVDAAQRIEAGDLSVRVREHGPREVRAVASAFNRMTAELEATDARRRQFLADVTHELRTPLSVIRGRAEGIIDGVYPGDSVHVGPVLEAARTLELLVEDLRTLALAEAGGLTLRREEVDLGVLVNETVTTFDESARQRGITLTATGVANLPPVQADPARLQSVLSNLVTNALRHTPGSGTVEVAIDQPDNRLRVTVRDSGPGIDAEILPHVFERFVKGVDAGGSGLGLAIARDLVIAHGGEIGAANDPAGGARIWFLLPTMR